MMYTRPDAPDKLDVKGIQLVRRDNCPLVKEVSTDMLNAIMRDKNAETAVEVARAHVSRVLSGECPLEKFVVSKTLRSDYKNTAQPHLYVARKLAQRRGTTIPSGSRVPYVFVEDLDNPEYNPAGLQAEKAEDPAHVEATGMPLDVLYYIEHQLASPIEALLDLLVDNPTKAVFDHPAIKEAMDALRARRDDALKTFKRLKKNRENRQLEITKFLTRK